MLRSLIAVLLAGMLSPARAAEPRALLPQPQQIHHGTGQIPIRGLTVRLPAGATSEDAEVASVLSTCLSDRSHGAVPLSTAGASLQAIVLRRTGTIGALPTPGEPPGPDSREAYWLTITSGGVELRAVSSAGLYYGVQTLCQLAEGAGESAALPEVTIHDWPAFAYRGTMVDMSHGPLPTEGEVKRQLDLLARWKANQYYFYSEASIQLDGYPLLNPGGRFTQDEVRRIIAYGRARHIDVIPCLELYGHLHDLFRVEKYSGLADLPHGTEFDPRTSGVMPLLADWARQYARLFPSLFVHIGFDEAFQIEMAAKEGASSVNPVHSPTRRRGPPVSARGQDGNGLGRHHREVPANNPATAAGTYRNRVGLYPGPPEHYEPRLGPLAAHHIPHLVASGVTSWNQISPDMSGASTTLTTFLPLAVSRTLSDS